MMRDVIKEIIEDAVKKLWPDMRMPAIVVSETELTEHGDYASSVAMVLARALKKNPMEVAGEIAEELRSTNQELRIEIAEPGFLNFFITEENVLALLREVANNSEEWGEGNQGRGKTIVVEYFQLNIAKRPHIGHIRSAIIGDALKRMLCAQGYHAVSDTHVGDWGTQFGILLCGYKEAGADLHNKQEAIDDPFGALEEIYLAENMRMKENPERREHAKQEFAKLEQGDKENREIWRWMVEVSMKNLKENAKRLGLLPFDEHKGESFYEDKMAPIVRLALEKGEKGIAKKTSARIAGGEEGAVIVDLTSEGLDEAVLIKSDGASTYLLRDLATIQYRAKHWQFWKNLYVVDVRQSHHFKQVFRVAELLGFDAVGASEHIAYGFMTLLSGALSTRGGNVISLEKVLDAAVEKARTVIKEKNPDLADAEHVARMVGIGALKYFDLSHHRKSDIVFSWDRALSFEGNTGPYVQYAYARLKSILRKANLQPTTYNLKLTTNYDSIERELAVTVLRFPEAIEDALAAWSPHVLAGYLYKLASQANEFYHAHPVLQEEDEDKKQFRFALVFLTAETLKKGLYLLGIEAPEEM